MKLYVSEKDNDQVLIIDTETLDEAKTINKFELVHGPLTAKVLHAPKYSTTYLEIRRSES